MNFLKFVSPKNEQSIIKNVPIEKLDEVRQYMHELDTPYRIRFRGPRSNPLDKRSKLTRRSVCLKEFATTFSVYPK